MAERSRRIDIDSLPGAKKHKVRWMLGCGVRTAPEAREAAEIHIANLDKKKGRKGVIPPVKRKKK